MGKTNIPPIPGKGQTVYKHKKETVKFAGKTYPRFMTMKARTFAGLSRENRSKWTVYQEFGQPDPNQKKVAQPPIPNKNANNGESKIPESKEQKTNGTNEQGGVGEAKAVDKVKAQAGTGDAGQSGEATNTSGSSGKVETGGGTGGTNSEPNASNNAIALAKENNIDLSTVTGTGNNGQITAGDIKKLIPKVD